MTKKGWTLVAMGFTGKKATQFKLDYIDAFDEMEQELAKPKPVISLPQNYAQALRQLAEQVELNESLSIENNRLKQTDNTVLEQVELLPDVLYTTEELAEEIDYPSARALNNRMHAKRVIYYSKKEKAWLLYAPYKDRGLKDMSTKRKSQMWTEKGREFIKIRFTENK